MFLPVLCQDLNIYFLKYGLLIVHLLEIFIVFKLEMDFLLLQQRKILGFSACCLLVEG